MSTNRSFSNILSSGMQAVAVQVLGSAFFYLISVYLSKADFGLISWMNAVCLLLITLLGFGLEQVVVRRIAASSRSDWAAIAFLAHSVAGFLITLLLLMLLKNLAGIYHYLPWFFAAQGLIYIGVPLKQFLNAKERFTPYGIIATISNSGKLIAVLVLLKMNLLNLHSVIIVLIASGAFELICLFIYVVTQTTFSVKLKLKAYTKLLKEASAQYLSVIFDISLSRMDWILLGLLTSNITLADYSFAYRAFELARLPMLIIGPVILPKLARLMTGGKVNTGAFQIVASAPTVPTERKMILPTYPTNQTSLRDDGGIKIVPEGRLVGSTNQQPDLKRSVGTPREMRRFEIYSVSTIDQQKINSFCTIEVFLGASIPLIINILWVPVVTFITKGKYGDVNAMQFLLLSFCVPVQLFINLLWSVSFSARQYRQVTTITIVCAVLNVLLNLILIPRLNGLGAAIAFLATTVVQAALYFNLVRKSGSGISLKPVLFFILSAAAIYFFVTRLNIHCVLQLFIAAGIYTLAAILLRQVNKQHWLNFKAFLIR